MIARRLLLLILAAAAGMMILYADFIREQDTPAARLREIIRAVEPSAAPEKHPQVEDMRTTEFLASLAAGIAVMYAVPKQLKLISKRSMLRDTIVRRFLIGLAALLVLMGIMVLSVFTPFTFPLAILSVLIVFSGVFLGSIAVLLNLAGSMFNRVDWGQVSPIYKLGYGLLLFTALGAIPYLGTALRILVWVFGFGGAVSTKFGSGSKWTLQPLVEEQES